MLPPMKTLSVFRAVAENLSFSKAALQLHVTHSAVSQSIRTLESYLGHTLFTRTSKQVILTEDGENYYASISSALRIIGDATDQQLSRDKDNVLTIKVMSTLTLLWFIPRLPSLNSIHPDIDLRLSSLEYQPTDFEQNNINAAIVYGSPEQWPGLIADKLFGDSLVLVGNRKHIECDTKLVALLQKNKAIYVDAKIRAYDWSRWCKAANIKSPIKANRIKFQNTAQALQAAVSGVGVIVTHKPFVQDLINSKRLSVLGNVEHNLKQSYYLLYKKDFVSNKYFQMLSNWIKNESKGSQF